MTTPCLLCETASSEVFFQGKRVTYLHCSNCTSVFVPKKFHLTPEQEKARYDTHNNSLSDQRYLNFVGTLAHLLQQHLPPPALGLDFGAGRSAPLAYLLQEQGYQMEAYDPYFLEKQPTNKNYDFLLATEVIEHLREPLRAFNWMNQLVRSKGWIGFKSDWLVPQKDFGNWYYKNDPTHLIFYSQKSLEWIAKELQWTIVQIKERDILFRKNY